MNKLLSLNDVRERLPIEISHTTIVNWVTRGSNGRKLKASQIGKRYYVAESDLDAFLSPQNKHGNACLNNSARSQEVVTTGS